MVYNSNGWDPKHAFGEQEHFLFSVHARCTRAMRAIVIDIAIDPPKAHDAVHHAIPTSPRLAASCFNEQRSFKLARESAVLIWAANIKLNHGAKIYENIMQKGNACFDYTVYSFDCLFFLYTFSADCSFEHPVALAALHRVSPITKNEFLDRFQVFLELFCRLLGQAVAVRQLLCLG